MARKMLAFLGTNDYLECNYVLADGRRVDNVRFVQEAVVRLHCMGWTSADSIIVFLTDEAHEANWLDNGHARRVKEGRDCAGLGSRFAALSASGFDATVKTVPNLPHGNTTDEIWQVFSRIVEQVDEGDELIFDVTHGFRSLPMLAVVLANYLRMVKKALVRHVFYGAFESLGTAAQAAAMPVAQRDAPLLDLIAFVALFDWTAAVRDFLVHGAAAELKACAGRDATNLIANAQGGTAVAEATDCLVSNLERLSSAIATCRCPSFTSDSGGLFTELKDAVRKCSTNTLPALSPLLDQIEAKVAPFNEKDPLNGFAAARWCLQHGLIQQGYTILQETYVTIRLQQWFARHRIDPMSGAHRTLVKAVHFVLRHKKEKGVCPPIEEIKLPKKSTVLAEEVLKVATGVSPDELEPIRQLDDIRNDLNHAGWQRRKRKSPAYGNELGPLIDAVERLVAD